MRFRHSLRTDIRGPLVITGLNLALLFTLLSRTTLLRSKILVTSPSLAKNLPGLGWIILFFLIPLGALVARRYGTSASRSSRVVRFYTKGSLILLLSSWCVACLPFTCIVGVMYVDHYRPGLAWLDGPDSDSSRNAFETEFGFDPRGHAVNVYARKYSGPLDEDQMIRFQYTDQTTFVRIQEGFVPSPGSVLASSPSLPKWWSSASHELLQCFDAHATSARLELCVDPTTRTVYYRRSTF